MSRKLSLVVVAAASLGVAALAPTAASAWGGHGWHGGWHGGGWGYGGPRFYVGGPAYYGPGYGFHGGCYVLGGGLGAASEAVMMAGIGHYKVTLQLHEAAGLYQAFETRRHHQWRRRSSSATSRT